MSSVPFKKKEDRGPEEEEDKKYFEKLKYPLTIQTRNVQKDKGQKYIQKLFESCQKKSETWSNQPFHHLCQLSTSRYHSKSKELILIPKANEYEEMAALTMQFCAIQKAKAKRHDQPLSSFERWVLHPEQVIEHAEKTTHQGSTHGKHWRQCTREEKEHELAYSLNARTPSLFPLKVVLCLIDKFQSTCVLDISAGWGDRLLGCCLKKVKYYARDPNSSMSFVYHQMIQTYGDPALQKVECAGFEDDEKEKNLHVPFQGDFDLLLSSPPFFNLEIYSSDANQSIEKYPELDTWLVEFLWKSLYKSNLWLKTGAYIVLHLCDVTHFKDPSKSVSFVERTLNYCTNVLKWTFIDCMGYAHFHQGKIQTIHSLAKAQPLWVFQKN